jgi:hypothetical protein
MGSSNQPTKLGVTGVTYDNGAEQFEIHVTAEFGEGKASEGAMFVISSKLEVKAADGTVVATVTGMAKAEPRDTPDAAGSRALVPQKLFWDRNGKTFSGTVSAELVTELMANGVLVEDSAATYTGSDIKIEAGTDDPTASGVYKQPE